MDTPRTITGDPNVYGKVYIGFSGSGDGFYSTNGPALRAIGFTPSGGTLGIGATTTIALGLSEPVTVTGGSPTLTLNSGGTASYTSGSGTDALTFTYVVGSGQTATSLAVTAINLNGATIVDSGGNAASLALSGLTQTGPEIATLPASITSVVEAPSAVLFGPGASGAFTLNMSSSVNVSSTTPTLTLNDGDTASYTGSTGTTTALTFGYTIGSSPVTTSDLAASTVNLNGATISNAQGNANLSLAGLTQTGPAVSTTSPSYLFRTINTGNFAGGSSAFTFSGLNLGTGPQYTIVAAIVQNQPAISSITCNGANLSPIVTDANYISFYGGNCTATSSNSIIVNTAAAASYYDVDISVWTATNSNSTTPVSSNSMNGTTATSSASVGNFVFGASGAGLYSSSTQAPHGAHQVTGANNTTLSTADWTALPAGISGGAFTATNSSYTYQVIGVWH